MVQQDHFMYILLYCSRKLLQPVKINFGQLQRTWLHVIFLYQISLLSSIDCHCNLRLCEFWLLSLIFSQLVHNYCKLE